MGGVLTATPTRFLRHVNLVRHRRCRGSDCPRFRRGRKSHLGVADGRLAAHGGLVVQPLQRTPHHLQQYVETSGLSARLSRSEEHTSELQSQSNLVCRLLLEKKKK